ncbi:MAG: hypothetical protein QXU18_12280 [Thermoplasmatales archaeon]
MIITKQIEVPDWKATENGIVLEVTQETEPEDPRQWDNFGKMVCWHNGYKLGDRKIDGQSGLDSVLIEILDEKFNFTCEQKENILYYADTRLLLSTIRKHTGGLVLPLYLYDHSGLSMSTSNRMYSMMDSAGWDWGTVGIIYATEKDIEKEYGSICEETLNKARDCLEQEVKTYDLYLKGESYWYRIYDSKTGETIDSCGGFLTDSETDLKEMLKYNVPEEYTGLVDKLESCSY